ncbi:MAG: transposase, partial [Phocaeicola sp.]|nr:transposase [Phocaeicola sp.]
MHHERRMFLDETADSGNGFRPRHFCYGHYEFHLKVPRTRQGSFYPVLLAVIKREDEERARLFTSLYSKGLTTEQIGEVAEELYGKHYSKQQVSYLSRSCAEEVEAWLNRELSSRYLAVFIDATFSPTRREDSVRREAYYTLLGLLPDGRREVLGIVNHPTEGAINWKQELLALHERDVRQIDLIISDALTGIENAVAASFPMAKHQLCVTHLKRNMAALVPYKKRAMLMEELKE